MKLQFDTKNNKKQKQCVKYWNNKQTIDIVYGGSKGSAKSYTGCSLIFGDALTYPKTHYFIARKKLNDLRKFTVPSIHEVFEHWGVGQEYYKHNQQDNFFDLYNGSKVFLLDAKYLPSDPDYSRFGSMQMTRGWIEEAGEFQREAKANLHASVGRWKNDIYNLHPKLLQTCNPSKNYLYSDYYKPNKEGTLEHYKKFIQALPKDNKMLPEGYIKNLELILSPNEKERLLYGNWEYDDDPDKLFEYEKILELFTNEFVKEGRERYLTCDIAYEGSDLFVIGVWFGLVLTDVIAFEKVDETQVSKKIREAKNKYRIPQGNIVYDADGLKRFVRQSKATGFLRGAKAFYNNGKVIRKENYFNLKAQCYSLLAQLTQRNEIFIKTSNYRKQIIEELEQIKKLPLSDDGKIRLEKKHDLQKRLGRSPDFADMLMMRMIFVLKSTKKGLSSSPRQTI